MAVDSGFSMVELLVALALAALVAMASAGLLTLGLTVRDRVEAASQVQAALLDLKGLTNALAAGSRVSLFAPATDGFVLRQAAGGVSPLDLGRFRMIVEPSSAVVYEGSGLSSSVDLSAFDQVGIEYLEVTPQAHAWKPSGQLVDSPAAARLRLTAAALTWRLLLWMQQPDGSRFGEEAAQ